MNRVRLSDVDLAARMRDAPTGPRVKGELPPDAYDVSVVKRDSDDAVVAVFESPEILSLVEAVPVSDG